jgi:hypothetical protein
MLKISYSVFLNFIEIEGNSHMLKKIQERVHSKSMEYGNFRVRTEIT